MSAEASVPGGGWTSQHDRIKRAMAESAREMGQEVAMEVYGLFASNVSAAAGGGESVTGGAAACAAGGAPAAGAAGGGLGKAGAVPSSS